MRDLLEHITNETGSKLDAVLHVGAGMGRELDHYLRREADRVLLVEANPKLAARLRARARNAAQIEVIDAAVAANGGEATLWFLNKPQETSLYRPTQLLERYPNLRVTHRESIRTITLGELVERLSPDPSRNNLLVLELQGAELSVLRLIPEKLLQKFSWIITRSSNEALYDEGAQLEDVESALRTLGFARAAPAEDVPGLPFQEVLFRRDALQIQLAELNGLLKEREERILALDESLQNQTRIALDRRAEVERLTEERDVLTHQREQDQKVTESLQLRVRALEKECAQLSSQHVQDLDQLTRARDEQARLAGERQAQLERLTKERDEHAKLAIERKVEVERLTKARDEQAKLAQTKQAEIDRQMRLLQDDQARIAQLESQLAELTKRQTLLSEEIVKAEGQIDVIKHVLLREPEA